MSFFLKIVVEKLKSGKLMSIVDPRLLEGRRTVDEGQLKKMVYIALWCIQEKVRRRPTMAQVVDMLEGHLRVDEPPETEMIIVDLLSIGAGNVAGKNRMKATGVYLSDLNTKFNATTASEPSTVLSGR